MLNSGRSRIVFQTELIIKEVIDLLWECFNQLDTH
jgi:hypothetical protein